jgi:hypothetical protein
VKPWIAIAVLVAVVLAGYYLFLGVRFGLALQQAASVTGRIEEKSPGSLVLSDNQALELSLATGEQQLEEGREWYSLPPNNGLMARLSAVAGESRVDLISVTGVDPVEETRGTVQYLVQPMTANIQGDEPEDIYRFISLLGETPPVTTVSSISMSGLDGGTTAQIRFLFFFLSEAAPENPPENREDNR